MNGNTFYWWQLWNQVGRKSESGGGTKAKVVDHYLDYPCFPILFEIYGIDTPEEKQTVFNMMCLIVNMHDGSPLSREQIFGWAAIPDD